LDFRMTKKGILTVACAIGGLGIAGSALARDIWVDPARSGQVQSGQQFGRLFGSLASAVATLRPGDTMHIAAGIYREELILPKGVSSIERPVKILGSGQVIISGANVVTGWSEKGWGVFESCAFSREPQQVFFRGRSLRQVGGSVFGGYPIKGDHPLSRLHVAQGGIWPGRVREQAWADGGEGFRYDRARKCVQIRVAAERIDGGDIEVSVRSDLFRAEDVSGLSLSGIVFRHASTSTESRQAAVTIIGRYNGISNIEVDSVDGVGVEISGDGNVVEGSRIYRSGQLGLKARGRAVRIQDNIIAYNNTRGFNKWWEAGGLKSGGGVGLHDSWIVGNTIFGNVGDGVWVDWKNRGVVIGSNLIFYNTGFGVHYEASFGGRISSNFVLGNGQRGIYLANSAETVVESNAVGLNGLEQIAVSDEGRQDPKGEMSFAPIDNVVRGNCVLGDEHALLVLPKGVPSLSDRNYFLSPSGAFFSLGWAARPWDRLSFLDWQKESGGDRSSQSVAFRINKEFQSALRSRSLGISRSELSSWLRACRFGPEFLGEVGARKSEGLWD
jgi:parallel beta-helix repeat protein